MSQPAAQEDITKLLDQVRQGQEGAADRLASLVYDELHRIAVNAMRREDPGHTLQPTELAHDAYLKLVDQTATLARDRAHFLGIAARAMRQILVDHARRRRALKRGAVWERVTFNEMLGHGARQDIELLALDEALTTLAARDERAARVVELRLFGGLTIEEIAESLGISKRTVDGDWALARLWIARALSKG
jgi:RNA polymerase sigma factor (TIGR02999 family)